MGLQAVFRVQEAAICTPALRVLEIESLRHVGDYFFSFLAEKS